MIAVIQAAAGRQPGAGHMKTRDGRRVLFVADPARAPVEPDVCHARPDATSNFCVSWRKLVLGYNENPRDNPLGLLPAYLLYPDEIYSQLVEQLGSYKVYILSAGWGLIKSSFLTPNYDISLGPDAEPFRLRHSEDTYSDFCMLPANSDEDLYFLGGEEYLPLFCRLTAAHPGRRIVFHPSAKPPEAPGCTLRRFESGAGTQWLEECAKAFLADQSRPPCEKRARKVSHIESRLRQTMGGFPGASLSLTDDAHEPDEAAVRAAIRDARDEIAEYLWLMRSLHEVDVTDDSEFQQRFDAYHRISRRAQEWHTAYFWLLETAKAVGADFADILYTLWDRTGRYDPAYSSRLVAAIDPTRPNWDRLALMNSGLRAPAYPDPEKLEKAVTLYHGLCDWYSVRLASPGSRRILELFDEEVPDHGAISDLKKLELVLRHTRAGNSVFPHQGRVVATLSGTA
jgi:hypothetical protein